MRLAVCVMSRGNPSGLATVVANLRALASNAHPVSYYVRCDEDDPATEEAAHRLNVEPIVGARPETIGQAWNEAAAGIPQWDAFCMMADDVVPTADRWDMTVARSMKLFDVVSWTEQGDPYNPTLPVISRNYYEKVGYVAPEFFPFWFNDTWVAEVQMLAHGFCPIISDLTWYGERGKTKSLRDLPFWIRLFASTRDIRCREAEKLSGGTLHKGVIKEREANDRWLLDNAQMLECTFGTGEPPDERYLRAKARAANFMEREIVD